MCVTILRFQLFRKTGNMTVTMCLIAKHFKQAQFHTSFTVNLLKQSFMILIIELIMICLRVVFVPQLVSFGLSNEMMVTFKEENIIAFKHFFLKNYQDRNNNYALYTRHEVHDHILHIIDRVSAFEYTLTRSILWTNFKI